MTTPLSSPSPNFREGFVLGWCRFWGAFAQPLSVVVGFIVASAVSRVVFVALGWLATEIWQ